MNQRKKGKEIFVENISYVYPERNNGNLVYDIDIVKSEIESDDLINKLKEIDDENRTHYNPFLVEFLLDDSINLLNKLIQLRSSIKDLESLLIKDTCKKLLFKKRTESNADGGEYYVSMIGDFQKKILDDTLKNDLDKIEKDIKEMSENEDSGLHYLNRYIFLKKIYWDDFILFFSKIKSVEIGLRTVYPDVSTDLPELPPKSPRNELLNNYYTWIKIIINKLVKLLETEQEQIFIYDFANGYKSKDRENTAKVIFYNEDLQPIGDTLEVYSDQRNLGTLRFKFTTDFFNKALKGKRLFRIREIGAYCVWQSSKKRKDINENDYVHDKYLDFTNFQNLKVTLPQHKDINNNIWKIPQLFFSMSSLNNSRLDLFGKSLSYYNANPISRDNDGVWEIEIAYGSNLIDEGRPEDFYLVLKLAFIDS